MGSKSGGEVLIKITIGREHVSPLTLARAVLMAPVD